MNSEIQTLTLKEFSNLNYQRVHNLFLKQTELRLTLVKWRRVLALNQSLKNVFYLWQNRKNLRICPLTPVEVTRGQLSTV